MIDEIGSRERLGIEKEMRWKKGTAIIKGSSCHVNDISEEFYWESKRAALLV